MKKLNKIQKIVLYIVFFVGIWCLPVSSQKVYATDEIGILQTALSHLKEDVVDLENQLNTHIQNDSTTDGRDGVDGKDGVNGKDGVGISNIEKTGTNGNVDIYTISLTNGTNYNFTVTNGTNGEDGKDGVDGRDGIDGEDGQDGVDGKDAVLEEEANRESSSTIGVVAAGMAALSLIGNIVLTAVLLKKK